MIYLEWSNLTQEIDNLEKLREYVRIHKTPKDAEVRMRIQIPLCALEDIVQHIEYEKGKCL